MTPLTLLLDYYIWSNSDPWKANPKGFPFNREQDYAYSQKGSRIVTVILGKYHKDALVISFIIFLIINFFSNNTVSLCKTFMTKNTKSSTNGILPRRTKRNITLDLQRQNNRKQHKDYSALTWYQIHITF